MKNKKTKKINDELMQAISAFDTEKVKICLEKGADPNYKITLGDLYSAKHQPDTPLRLVMFRISDNFLEDEALNEFKKIAQLLLENGADPAPAMQIAETRYGKYSEELESNPFTDVWHTVAEAYKQQKYQR